MLNVGWCVCYWFLLCAFIHIHNDRDTIAKYVYTKATVFKAKTDGTTAGGAGGGVVIDWVSAATQYPHTRTAYTHEPVNTSASESTSHRNDGVPQTPYTFAFAWYTSQNRVCLLMICVYIWIAFVSISFAALVMNHTKHQTVWLLLLLPPQHFGGNLLNWIFAIRRYGTIHIWAHLIVIR